MHLHLHTSIQHYLRRQNPHTSPTPSPHTCVICTPQGLKHASPAAQKSSWQPQHPPSYRRTVHVLQRAAQQSTPAMWSAACSFVFSGAALLKRPGKRTTWSLLFTCKGAHLLALYWDCSGACRRKWKRKRKRIKHAIAFHGSALRGCRAAHLPRARLLSSRCTSSCSHGCRISPEPSERGARLSSHVVCFAQSCKRCRMNFWSSPPSHPSKIKGKRAFPTPGPEKKSPAARKKASLPYGGGAARPKSATHVDVPHLRI